MPVVRADPIQVALANKWEAVENLARQAGFNEDEINNAEFSLVAFFDMIVDKCAVVAREQGWTFSGEHKEMNGCIRSSDAIKHFGDSFGNDK